MERVRLTDMAHAIDVHAEGTEGVEVSGVSTDSRTVERGDLFFAIRGENFDGHEFVGAAITRGACAAVVEDPSGMSDEGPLLVVDDTVEALQGMAGWYRDRFDVPIVGVTGTNGKTTTKDMIAAVLSTRLSTAKTRGNYNNHIGVPLTLFRLDGRHEAAVVEMGMNHPGEIAHLATLARPVVGVITNVAEAHLETMHDLDAIADAKAELIEALPPDGTAVLNWDDERVKALWARGPARVVTFGTSPDAEVRAIDIEEDTDGVCFELADGGSVELPVPGRHNVMNALAAVAVGRVMGISDEDSAWGLASFEPSPMRMKLLSAGRLTILNDAYNCNPGSLAAALEVLVASGAGGATGAAIGDMMELGEASARAHRQAGLLAAKLGVGRLFLFGHEVRALAEGAIEGGMRPSEVRVYEDKAALADAVRTEFGGPAVLLVKGSRGMRMEEVVELLTGEAPAS